MAPLSPDNTPRFRVSYFTVGFHHTLEVRSHISPSALGTLLDSFWTALAGAIRQTTVEDISYAPSGSSVFNPVTTGIEGNIYGTGAGDPSETAWFYGFVGRTSGGRRARWFIYGAGNQGHDYRFVAGESTSLSDARDILAAAGTDIRAIDDLTPTWKTYINAGTARHWVKVLRS